MFLAVVFGKNVAESSIGHWFALSHHQRDDRDGALHDCRRDAAGLDAADAARVSQHLHEDRHDRVPGHRRDDPQPRAEGAGVLAATSTAAARSSPASCSRSSSSPSRAARFPGSTRSSRPGRRRRWSTGKPTSGRSATAACSSRAWSASSRSSPRPRCTPATTTPSTPRPAVFANLGIPIVNLAELQSEVGEVVAGRPGGAVSLAVGMAQIFSGLPGMRGLMAYWYHFAIMFEARVHPHHHRLGHAHRPLPAAGVRRPSVEAVRPHRLAAGQPHLDRPDGAGLGILHLDRQHQHGVADVRRRQPAAGGRRASLSAPRW